MKPIKNIIFDYGNVIFLLDFKKLEQSWSAIDIDDPENFFSHSNQNHIFDAFDRGELSAEEFRVLVRKSSRNSELTDEAIDAAWNSLLIGVDKGTHELLAELNKKYRTFLLSNINPIHFEYVMNYLKSDFGFDGNDHLFEKTYYSHLIGMRKPSAEIFHKVLAENNLKAEETLFIDDSPKNIDMAKALGINTFLMTAPDTIQDFVTREGLI